MMDAAEFLKAIAINDKETEVLIEAFLNDLSPAEAEPLIGA